ncbi:MAG: cytochrome c biogenesis CcdA family protein [Thermoleophilia bacterium]
MRITEVSVIAYFWAMIAGLAAFLSPCVLPLLPGYLSFVSGVGIDELGARTRKVGIASAAFVLGFVIFFSLQGAAAGLIGSGMGDFIDYYTSDFGEGRRVLEIIAGVFLVIFGILTLGVIKASWFQRERRFRLKKPASLVGVMIAGMVFSLGIGPCTGPLLGSVLLLAAQNQDPLAGASLLFFFGLGMGVPFVIFGFLFTRMIGMFGFLKRHLAIVRIVSGGLLIIFGLLLATGELTEITRWLNEFMPTIEV